MRISGYDESYKKQLEECDPIFNDSHPSSSLDNLQWIGEKGGNSCCSSTFDADHDDDGDDGDGGYDDGHDDGG